MEATDLNTLFAELEAIPLEACRWCGAPFLGADEDGPALCPDCTTRLVYPA